MDWGKLQDTLEIKLERPPNSFTAKEFSEKFGYSGGGYVHSLLRRSVKEGKLQCVKLSNIWYYFLPEKKKGK